MSQRIEARKTEITFQDLAASISRAWEKLLNKKPSVNSLCVLLAQSALETGQWKYCYCYNLGNAKANDAWKGDFCFYFADEILSGAQGQKALAMSAPRTDGKPGDNITLKALPDGRAQVTLYPDHPICRFRAFTSLDDGALDYLALLNKRFTKSWPALEAGDPEGFIRALKEQGYFTASVERYLPPVLSLFEKYKRALDVPPPPKSAELTEALRAEYEDMFRGARLNAAQIELALGQARRIAAERERYENIAAATGVPWYVIGALHLTECDLDFGRHLHNGDPLSAPTLRAPKGRPSGAGPFTFEQSAADALRVNAFAGWGDYSLAGTLYRFEMYNGFGYRWYHPDIKSPYLWSFTDRYTKGAYAGGKFDAGLVYNKIGVAAILRAMQDSGMIDLLSQAAAFGDEDEAPKYPGRVIQRAEPDREIVRQIQRRLAAVGCGAPDVDGIFGGDTESSVKLFQSRNEDPSGRPLSIDGKIGAVTWEALFGSDSVATAEPHDASDPLLALALTVAETQVNVREEPRSANRGKEVDAYQKAVGNPLGVAWCAAFVYWCYERAATELGVENPLVRTGGCMVHWVKAQAQGVRVITARQALEDPSLVQPGQIFVMDHGGGKGHTGVVRRVQGGMVETIEGNTNMAGSREGDGVYVKQRRIEDINAGFIDYSRRQAAAREETEAKTATVVEAPIAPPTALTDVAALDLSLSSGGLLVEAVKARNFEPPTWVDVPFQGHIVRVGAQVLRAQVGGKLLRLPVSYQDVIAICNTLGWVPPTSELSDAIFRAAAVRASPAPQGRRDTPQNNAIADRKMRTLEFVVSHDAAIERQIPAGKRGALTSSQGKDWIISPRNATRPDAATTYGWHQPSKSGAPIQGLGSNDVPPAHNDLHFDYSQTMRPIQRMAKRVSDGAEVDLLDVLAKKLPADVISPFPPEVREPTVCRDDDEIEAPKAAS